MQIIIPKTKKGPKGIASFNFFFFHKISMIPTIPPVKNAKYSAKTVLAGPSTKPIKKANFTSPNPIPRVLVIRNIIIKKANAPSPASR